MNTFDLGRILEEVHWDEYAEFGNPPHHIKSLHHRLQMRRIMNQAVEKHAEPLQHTRMKLSPRKVLILLVLIFTAIITAAAIVVWYGNIYGQRHLDNTELFAPIEGVPKVIEKIYELTEIPDGYVLAETSGGLGYTYFSYTYESEDWYSIYFAQYTRGDFNLHIDNEQNEILKTEIMGMNVLITSVKDDNNILTEIFWDRNDYILEISANLPLDETAKLLKSAKIVNS